MRWLVVAGMCLVAGCATTPDRLRESSNVANFPLKGDYQVASDCVMRQLAYRGGITSTLLRDDARHTAEILVKGPAADLVMVVDVVQQGQATSGRIVVSRSLLFTSPDSVVESLRVCS